MLRVAGSLKLGWVTASLFIAKLQSFRRQNVLTRALQEYGRLNKTIFILRYLLDVPFQRRIGAQINKGEALHARYEVSSLWQTRARSVTTMTRSNSTK
jgi:TnpA family transposase